MAKQRIRCTVCGAKNDLVDHCRICASLLPGADKRRREGAGGRDFHTAVEAESEAWKDYREGRMSGSGRSRRPAELPDAPPGTWGLASAVRDEDAAASPAHAQFAPPPGGVVIDRTGERSGGLSAKAAVTVLAAVVLALIIGFAAYSVLV